jgi:Carbohydrate binding domain
MFSFFMQRPVLLVAFFSSFLFGMSSLFWHVRFFDYADSNVGEANHTEYFSFRETIGSGREKENKWRLQVHSGNAVHLDFPTGQPDILRIDINKTQRIPWHIQVNRDGIAIRSLHGYALAFRARADRVRNIAVAVSKGHEPWYGLGLYKTIGLTPDWQSFELEFKSIEDDDYARIHFDIAGDGGSVELSGIALRGLR